MNVRSFQLSDSSRITELLQIALSEECYEKTIGPFSRQLSWDSELILVAEDGDQLVGVMIGTIEREMGCYYRVAVHPDYRRQGIGKALVAKLEGRFQQRKVKSIFVSGDEHNSPALPLYEAMGYGANRILNAFQKLSILAVH
ncbi:GNAT family N-acetyltransferase [Saccharibacillus sp. JS10]|uniref:GNAT family N-acetyltransferase n=1 Tax=Saccharibacillus sp. JS10 TaxID=2950552 RepID=UPI00210B8672|nr:GNAT family N-acetyltransferase [Saccharibacillus sp. JS10]MCQ4087322.1 GNAT family N-acetyltransferase [Saccharibacillus sp. JS10]